MKDRFGGIDRNEALDFAKGALVLFMLLYHWINYFVSIEGSVYVYLRFIPPSFIFISGFVVANVYPNRYGVGNLNVFARLSVRGLKLLALFVALNLAANIAFKETYKGAMPGIEGFFVNAVTIFTSGNSKAAFIVLVPLGYLLLFSAVIFKVTRDLHQHAVPIMLAMFVCCILLLDVYGITSQNLSLLAMGFLGLVMGAYRLEKINGWAACRYKLVSLVVLYNLLITVTELGFIMQAFGVVVSVSFIYSVGMIADGYPLSKKYIALLGQYSLFAYIIQICVLQLLQKNIMPLRLEITTLWIISFLSACALTFLAVSMADKARGRSQIVDRIYRYGFS